MNAKRVDIGLEPGARKSAEEWVTQPSPSVAQVDTQAPKAVMKRLTIDVPENLHRRLKVKAASDGVKMADLVRHWIEEGCS